MKQVLISINQNRLKALRLVASNDLYIALVAACAMVGLVIAIGTLNNHVIPLYPKPHFLYTAEPSDPLKLLSNWDGPDYLNIAKFNYRVLFDASFFPLYPALIFFLTFIFRSPLITALLISWTSLVGALYFYIKILRHLGMIVRPTEALKAIALFLLFPTGVFLLGTYTESLFSFLGLAAVYFALKKKWTLSALLLVLVSATHFTGLLVIGLVWLILIEEKVGFWKATLTAISGLLGFLAFAVLQQLRFGDPFAFIKSQQQIHQWMHHGLTYLWSTTGAFDILSIALIIAAGIYFWHTRKSFSLYSLAFLLIPLAGGQYGGFNRYVLTAYPVEFMLYGLLRRRINAYPFVLALSAVLWTLVALEYMAGYVGS